MRHEEKGRKYEEERIGPDRKGWRTGERMRAAFGWRIRARRRRLPRKNCAQRPRHESIEGATEAAAKGPAAVLSLLLQSGRAR